MRIATKQRRLRSLVGCAAFLVSFGAPQTSYADVARVPIALQVAFIVKIAGYDRKFTEYSDARVQVLIVVKPDNIYSNRAGDEIRFAFSQITSIVGRPHDETIWQYTTPSALGAICRQRKISIVVFTPGFSDDVAGIDNDLKGIHILSASVVAEDVAKGIVFGIDLVDARPKLVFNLKQAKLQELDMEAKALNLMKVYE